MAYFRRLLRSPRSTYPIIVAVSSVLAACGGGSSSPEESGGTDLPEDTGDDDPTDVSVAVDDDEITVTVADLPDEAGGYRLAIVRVDGQKTHSEVDLKAKGDALVGQLDLPKGLDSQAELVEWNVRLERKDGAPKLVFLKSLLYFMDPQEVALEGPARVTEGKQVAYRVIARHPLTQKRLPGREVELQLEREEETVETFRGTTDESGAAVIEVQVDDAGEYVVEVGAAGVVPATPVAETVNVEANGNKLLLTTDKPIYKPGQTIQLRALALARGGNSPVAEEEATFEVEDGKGNKVFKKTLKTDEFGIASIPFTIGNVVNEGTYEVRVQVGDVTSQKTVEVSQYALPKFNLVTTLDRPWYSPGDTISGVVDARYFFGKAVDGGSIEVEAATLDVGRNVYQQVMGTTNDEGRFEFSVSTPETLVGLPLEQGLALINLTITATDTAGQVVAKEVLVRVAAEPVNVSLVPEGTELVPGIDNVLSLFVTDPLGSPLAGAEATITPKGGEAIELTTDEFGQASLTWAPEGDVEQVSVDVDAGDVSVHGLTFDFASQSGTDHVLVRTDKSLYDVGEAVDIEVLTSDEGGSIFVDWLNNGQAIDLRTLEPKDGAASLEISLDEDHLGDNRIEAYIVQEDGNIVRAGRTIFVRNASGLSVEIETDQDIYEPGAPASITFNVKDEEGAPAVAALGVQIVDEAVFSLIDAKPGLLSTYFELEDEFAEPSYELHPPIGTLPGIVFDRPDDEAEQTAAQRKAAGTFAAIGQQALMGLSASSWPEVVQQGRQLLSPFFDDEKSRLVKQVNDQVDAAIDASLDAGCDLEEYWCDPKDALLSEVISKALAKRVEAVDFWGNRYDTATSSDAVVVLTSWGPDEVEGSADDEVVEIQWEDVDWSRAAAVVEHFGGEADAGVDFPRDVVLDDAFDAVDEEAGDPSAAEEPGPESPGAGESGGPRVRRDFPETLYYNAAVITNGSGEATVELDMADSITQWRISSMANSKSGRLGSAVGAMTVFQDFFVDVDFPATLTRGDEIDFPIAVYNYLDEPQVVNVELEAADWYTALGETALSVELAPGEVRGVNFPVRVEEVGLNTLTVFGLGGDKSDAVARTVRVLPDGKQLASAQSGALEGSVEHSVAFPEEAIPGSEQLYVNVYPTFVAQAVQGLDSMLQVPSGCFEQTTSNAWPNVLVTDYMKQTDQITPEILLRAESLMSAGYQRLLTFEHPGGGFSWFGTQDPEPFLSVTAFGLMEFHDMAKVHEVDEAMLQRTLDYLLSQQQADGSWEGDTSEFFSFHTSGLRNTAFTLMAIGAAGYTGSETELGLDYVRSELDSGSDPDAYTLALVANAFASVAPNDAFLDDLLADLAAMAQEDPDDETLVRWDTGGTQTNFYGYGNDAAITTTALVVHAMLMDGSYPDLVEKGLNALTASKDSLGNFGSTQATVWTLKTLLLAATRGTAAAVGDFVVEVDGEVFRSLELTEDQSDVMTTIDLAQFTTMGEHTVTLTFSGEGKVSYNLVSNHNVPWESAPMAEGPLSVSIDYDRTALAVDETVTAQVAVVNNTDQLQNMALVTLGLPPGFELLRQDFDPYIDAGSISRIETTGKQLIVYVSELGADSTLDFEYRLRATMPVKASDGGASVRPYYQPDQATEAPEQTLEVAAK